MLFWSIFLTIINQLKEALAIYFLILIDIISEEIFKIKLIYKHIIPQFIILFETILSLVKI